jgi:hypothetical protein
MKTRKDPNYIAAVEKAITEKYGKDTVQDFRNEWKEEKEKEYLNQLKEMRVKRDKHSTNKEAVTVGDVKITKRRDRQKQDRTCPVCKTYLYMNRFKCCHDCYIDFVFGREQAWKDGNRPTDEHIENALRRRK